MSTNNDASQSSESLQRESIYGPAPVLPDEDAAAYETLLAGVLAAIRPTGTIEQILVRDIVDLTWEILRWRRIRTDLITQAAAAALRARLSGLPKKSRTKHPDDKPAAAAIADIFFEHPSDRKLVRGWMNGNPDAISRISKLLSSVGTTIGVLRANAMIDKLGIIERVDQLTMIAEARRNAALREIDRHRFALAQALRRKINEIEDAEFETVAPDVPQVENDRSIV